MRIIHWRIFLRTTAATPPTEAADHFIVGEDRAEGWHQLTSLSAR